MTPVDAGKTCRAAVFSFAAVAAQQAVATFIAVRVAQLAFPALTRMALALPLDSFRCSRHRTTGAALTRLVVNKPAAFAGLSDTINARSSLFSFLIPAYVDAYR